MFADVAMKVLGIRWDTSTDTFFFDSTAIVEAASKITHLTKREVLRISSRIFDPLGLIAPTVLLLKITFQRLWECPLEWDDPVPQDIRDTWSAVIKGLADVADLRIPRWIGAGPLNNNELAELHVFGDASEAAYGAVAYVRVKEGQGDAKIRILCAKTRVAPSPWKKVSLPRLELLGALLAARLASTITGAINDRRLTVTLWSDSQVALAWIRGDIDRWKPFVRNQVKLIRQLSSPMDWKFCPGIENPADFASRGAPARTLVSSSLWWYGPHWLGRSKEEWPTATSTNRDENITTQIDEEAKRTVTVAAVTQQVAAIEWDLEWISLFKQLVRRTAWIL